MRQRHALIIWHCAIGTEDKRRAPCSADWNASQLSLDERSRAAGTKVTRRTDGGAQESDRNGSPRSGETKPLEVESESEAEKPGDRERGARERVTARASHELTQLHRARLTSRHDVGER